MAFALPVLAVLVPLIRGRPSRNIGGNLLSTLRMLLSINPAAIFVVIHGLSGQKILKKRDFASTMSMVGFASQIAVHIILAISFFSLVRIPLNAFVTFSWASMLFWYNLLGWPLVDNAIFAAVHGRLFWIALKERKKVGQGKYLLESR